jgi:hypothetical protein
MGFQSLLHGLQSFLQWVQTTSFATVVRENGFLFPTVEGLHVLASTFVVGSVAVVDLRLLGVKAFNSSIQRLMKQVLPLTWIAFGCAVLTGATLFSSDAVEYSRNSAFQLKFLALLLVGLNMLIFHFLTCRGLSHWDEALRAPAAVRFAGATSLLLWMTVVGCGRWIGFVDAP